MNRNRLENERTIKRQGINKLNLSGLSIPRCVGSIRWGPLALILLIIGFLHVQHVHGALGDTYYWKSEATSGNWDQDWWNSTQSKNENPDVNGGGNLTFDNNNQTTMDNDFDNTVRWRVTFESSASTARTIGGSTENTFNDSGGSVPKIENYSSVNHTMNFPIKVGYISGMEIYPVDGDLTIGGNINTDGKNIIVYGDNSKMLTLSGNVSGSGKIIIEQYSKVKVSGSSTLTGNVEIDEGEFWVDSGGSLGSGTIYVGNGGEPANVAKLWLSDSDGGLIVSRNIQVNSGNDNTRYIGGLNTSGVNTYSGTVTLSANTIVDAYNSGGTISFSGIISGDYDITLNGAGTVSMTAENTFGSTKTLYMNNGTLELNRASGDPLDVNEIKLGYQANDVTLKLSSSSGFTVDNQINVRSTSGTKKIHNSSGANTISSSIYLDAGLTSTAGSGSSLTYSGTEIDLKDQTLTVAGSGDTTISAKLTDSQDTGDIVKNGSGTLTVGNINNDFSGTVTVNAGTLAGEGKVSGSTTLTSGAIVSPGASVGTLTFGSGLTFESGSKYDWDISGSSVDSITASGTLTLPAGANSIEVIVTRDSAVNDTYTLITSGGIAGGDATAFWSSDLEVEFQLNGNNVEIVVTPEPGVVMGLVLAGLAMGRSKK